MKVVNVHQAKTHLSRFLELVESGEEIVLARAGKPVAKLVPYTPPRFERRPGRFRGQIRIAEDFDRMRPEELAEWYGEAEA